MSIPRLSRMNRRTPRGARTLTFLAAVIIIAALTTWIGYVNFWSERTATCTVTEKDWATKVSNGTSSSEYRIISEDCGVLKISDNLFRLQFNSADLYADIKTGHTYDLTLIGIRNGFFSMFPNIIAIAPDEGAR